MNPTTPYKKRKAAEKAKREAGHAYAERLRKRGIVQVGVRVPEHRKQDIIEQARKYREEG